MMQCAHICGLSDTYGFERRVYIQLQKELYSICVYILPTNINSTHALTITHTLPIKY